MRDRPLSEDPVVPQIRKERKRKKASRWFEKHGFSRLDGGSSGPSGSKTGVVIAVLACMVFVALVLFNATFRRNISGRSALIVGESKDSSSSVSPQAVSPPRVLNPERLDLRRGQMLAEIEANKTQIARLDGELVELREYVSGLSARGNEWLAYSRNASASGNAGESQRAVLEHNRIVAMQNEVVNRHAKMTDVRNALVFRTNLLVAEVNSGTRP